MAATASHAVEGLEQLRADCEVTDITLQRQTMDVERKLRAAINAATEAAAVAQVPGFGVLNCPHL